MSTDPTSTKPSRRALVWSAAALTSSAMVALPNRPRAQGYQRPAFPALAPALARPDARGGTELSGAWEVIVDPAKVGHISPFEGFPPVAFQSATPWSDNLTLQEWAFDSAVQLRVPGDWNSQAERLFFYEGDVWYHRRVDFDPKPGHRQLLCFGAVSYLAEVYVNGRQAGRHEGAFTPFTLDITDLVKPGDNRIVMRVNNELGATTIPTASTDWMNYGGITRPVWLVEVPQVHVRDWSIKLADRAARRVELVVEVAGVAPGTPVSVQFGANGERAQGVCDPAGIVRLSWRTRAALWSPSAPILHDLVIEVAGTRVSDRVGLRTIEARDGQLWLNGERLFLKGVSAHEESTLHAGRAFGASDARAMLELIQQLGGNFIRLAHYPHDEATVRLADELGILVWAEQPLYWGMAWSDASTLESAKAQTLAMVRRDRNRASVVLWSIANETPQTPARLTFLTEIARAIRDLDPTRPLTAALFGDPLGFVGKLAVMIAARVVLDPATAPETRTRLRAFLNSRIKPQGPPLTPAELDSAAATIPSITIADPLGEVIDVIGFNQYLGWYYEAPVARALGLPEAQVRAISLDILPQIKIRAALPKPVMISEFGADAKAGHRGQATQVFTEDFQADYYRRQLLMIAGIENLAGVSPWVLKDFRAPRRTLPRLQDYWNRKGLVDETGRRKLAFDVLATAYRTVPAFQ